MKGLALFESSEESAKAPALVHEGPFAAVAMEQSIDRTLDYAVPPALIKQIKIGQRVRVPLGKNNRSAFGYVTDIQPHTTYPKIKRLLGIDDERTLIPPALMDLARWMGRYYVTPLGRFAWPFRDPTRRRFWKRRALQNGGRYSLGCCNWSRKQRSSWFGWLAKLESKRRLSGNSLELAGSAFLRKWICFH